MDLILKSQTSDILLSDVGVIIKTGAGSSFNDPDANASIRKALGGSTALRALVAAGTVVVNDGTQNLGILAGLQYLNKQWFQSGSDIAVAMGQVEGVITNTQHGDRGNGSLHALATGSVAGFLSASDFTKLASITAGARPAIMMTMGDNNGPGTSSNVDYATPKILRYSVYRGTNYWTPNSFHVVASVVSAAKPGAVDLYDVTNGQRLCEITGINATTPTIYETNTMANLPAGEALIAARAGYTTGGATTITVYAVILARD